MEITSATWLLGLLFFSGWPVSTATLKLGAPVAVSCTADPAAVPTQLGVPIPVGSGEPILGGDRAAVRAFRMEAREFDQQVIYL